MGTVLKFAGALIAGWLVVAVIQTGYTHAMQKAVSNSDGFPAFAAGPAPTVNAPTFTYDPDCFGAGFGQSDGKPVNLNRCHAEQESQRQAATPH